MNTNIIALSPEVQKRYKEKVDINGGEDPYTVSRKVLSSDPEHFPRVTYPDIVNYLIWRLGQCPMSQLCLSGKISLDVDIL